MVLNTLKGFPSSSLLYTLQATSACIYHESSQEDRCSSVASLLCCFCCILWPPPCFKVCLEIICVSDVYLSIFRKTPIGLLNRLICNTLPGGLWKLDAALTGGRLAPAFRRLGIYLMDENHPLVLVRGPLNGFSSAI